MSNLESVAVIGAGSFGMALAKLLSEKGCRVSVYTRSAERAAIYTQEKENKEKLPGVVLPDTVRFTADLGEATDDCNTCVLVVPSIHVRETVRQMKEVLTKERPLIVSAVKGIERDTSLTMSEVIRDVLPDATCAILSGPTHAEEVGRGLPTAIVAGALEEATAKQVQDLFMTPVFRVYTSTDVKGIELGGALKNVIALAAGIADGMSYGDNAKAAMITRGVAEMTRLGVACGGRAETFAGLSGIGDLIVTCASMHSRNRRAGILIGRGKRCEEACAQVKMVVEGVHSAASALSLSEKYGIEMPIVKAVNRVLFEDYDPKKAVEELMLRDRKAEV